MPPISRREFTALTTTALTGGLLTRSLDGEAEPIPHSTAVLAPPRLIVRGDDMGYAHAGNQAIIESFVRGIETSIEVIAPSPWFPEAAAMLGAHPAVDVGVHLALSSEWDMVKWRPLTSASSLRDADGYFYPMIFPNANYPKRALSENAWRIEDIEREFRAQIELARKHIPRISHVSGHMGCTAIRADVALLARRLAKEYQIDIAPEDHGVINARWTGPRATSAEKIDSFIRMLDTLEADKTYLVVEHPGLDTPELRAIHHVGYEHVAADRQGVTDTFTSTRVRDRIRARGIQLISYQDLRR